MGESKKQQNKRKAKKEAAEQQQPRRTALASNKESEHVVLYAETKRPIATDPNPTDPIVPR